jgi:hypothetical protein
MRTFGFIFVYGADQGCAVELYNGNSVEVTEFVLVYASEIPFSYKRAFALIVVPDRPRQYPSVLVPVVKPLEYLAFVPVYGAVTFRILDVVCEMPQNDTAVPCDP